MQSMPRFAFAFVTAMLIGAPPATGQGTDSVAVVVRFGTDTLALERWVRTPRGLDAVSVSRSPHTTVNRWAVQFGPDGRVTHLVTAEGTTPVEPAGAIPTAAGFYAPQALALLQAARALDTLVVVPMLAGGSVQEFRVRRIGPDLFELLNPQGGVTARARLTSDGRLNFLEAGTSITVERVDWFDIDRWAQNFEARDARGTGFGPLSGRDTARVRTGGANIMIDYGQPSARGRTVFGGVVPYGVPWRTGANAATQLVVDRAIRIGDVRLEPGTYTLYTIPGRDSWQLGVSSGTGMAAATSPGGGEDVGRVAMSVRSLPDHVERLTILLEPSADGAVLRLRWERTEASIPIVVEDAR